MNKSTYFFLLGICVLVACNRKQAVVQEEPAPVVETVVEEVIEEPEPEPAPSSTAADQKQNADRMIDRIGNSIELSEDQKQRIHDLSSSFDFTNGTDEEIKERRKNFRQKVGESILTPDQRNEVRSARKNRPRNQNDDDDGGR